MSADTLPALPRPPAGLSAVEPAHDLGEWVRAHVLDPDGDLYNEDHAHLATWDAAIGWLWMAEPLHKAGSRILGTCAVGRPSGDAWAQAVKREQLERWFGDVPDFVVSLCARHAGHELEHGRPANVLAVVEHELYHAAIKRDGYGVQQFDRFGNPRWGVRPHDGEEFAGVILRYGVEASNAAALVAAADHVRQHGPSVAASTLEGVCGTCRRSISAG